MWLIVISTSSSWIELTCSTSSSRKYKVEQRISDKLMVYLALSKIGVRKTKKQWFRSCQLREMCSTYWWSRFETLRYQQRTYERKRRKMRSYSKC
ncbi:unnamed protein product [Hymenolepis diminuta]|uniref:Uncharacterized protein n=1 Tax=Hymenolepis diminuta TaxID=6216 RepID=A0A564YCV4_HYMDI|nr:unnamed protein product [Hymenolepis diminuta]